jgi:DNA-binding winged helix-turn-helix (wHTH) protein/membrane-associated phospholipid phosphatase
VEPESNHRVRFKAFEFDLNNRELRRNGRRLKLQGQPLEVLVILLERPNEVVTREQLRRRLWSQDTFVDFEHRLNSTIRRLREALGDRAENPLFIETLPRLGYRFIAPLDSIGDQFDKPVFTTNGSNGKTEIPTLNGDAVEFQPAQHFSSTELVAPNPPHRRHRRRPWLAGAATAILVFALIALWYAHRPLPPPHITEIVQLTSDVRFHRKVALGTDGARVYLSLEPPALGSVPVSGGDITEETKFPGERMRTSEWIQGGFATIIAGAAWIVPLPLRRRWIITGLALCAVAAISLARALAYRLAPVPGSILRDWLPLAITLIPYWQTGQFFLRPSEKIQTWLAASDRQVFALLSRTGFEFSRTARLSMEWAYSFCYPILPLGLATLYFAGMRRYADTYWFLVLVPTYLCYAITPFFPALPPRSLGNTGTPPRATKSRRFNLFISNHVGIHAISFPSAHVAASLGASLALLQYVPLAGAIFLAITFWIAVAAVVERYHYTIDVVLGALVALAVYLAWRAELTPSALFTAPAISLAAPL